MRGPCSGALLPPPALMAVGAVAGSGVMTTGSGVGEVAGWGVMIALAVCVGLAVTVGVAATMAAVVSATTPGVGTTDGVLVGVLVGGVCFAQVSTGMS